MKNRRMNTLILCTAIVTCLGVMPATAGEKMSDVAREHARSGKPDKVDVVVVYREMPEAAEKGRVASLGGTTKRAFQRLSMRVISIPAHRLDDLARGNGVRFVAVDGPVFGASAAAKKTARLPEPGSAAHVAASSGVAVAVLDSGVATHPDVVVQRHVDIIPALREQDPRATRGLQLLYDFEGEPVAVIPDVSGVGGPFDLTLEDSDRASVSSDTLTLTSATRASNATDANKVFQACTQSNELTIEAWIVAGAASQGGPARIVTLSLDAYYRNFSLTQDGDRYQFRLRTTTNGDNGMNTRLYSAYGSVSTGAMQHVVVTRDATGLASLYLDGVLVDTATISGTFTNWDASYDFAIGNEFSTASTTTERDWIGTYDLVGVYSTALTAAEVQQNFEAGSAPTVRRDPWGHGTHVAGIAAGAGQTYASYSGIAPGAPIVDVRVLGENGSGVLSDVLAGLDWVLVHGATENIRVVNLSLGKAIEESAAADPLVLAAEALWDAGLVVVASAGNYGRDGNFTITSPGNSRKIITVGSLTDAGSGESFTDDYVSTYSSRGPTLLDHYLKPDLLAPGNRLIAPMNPKAALAREWPERAAACGSGCSDQYLELSGTSMAAAMVSGTAALMLSDDPTLNPATVKARMMRSARKIEGDPTDVGAGVLDVTAVLQETGTVTAAPSPRIGRSVDGPVVVEDTAQLWGDASWSAAYLFSDAFIFSDAFVFSDGSIFTDAFIWSDSFVWTDTYIWSDAFVFTDAFIWSDAAVFTDAVRDLEPLMFEDVTGLTLQDDN